jgi:hypothetical protein
LGHSRLLQLVAEETVERLIDPAQRGLRLENDHTA